MTSFPIPVVCIGGATVDRNLTCTNGFALGVSNPVTSASSFGGVARNVAECLGRLKGKVELVSAVGNDAAGAKLRQHLVEAGVGVQHLITLEGCATAEYIAALEGGDMRAAFADMGIFDQLTPDRVTPALANLASASIVFADCNLPTATIEMLFEGARKNRYLLAIDGVSPAKCKRLPKSLDALGILFTNAAQVTDMTRVSSGIKGVERMLKRGCRTMVATMGPHGLILAEDTKVTVIPAPDVPIVSVSGAGDAIAAGTLLGLSRGVAIQDAVKFGVALATLVLQSVHTVPPHLSLETFYASVKPAQPPGKGTSRVH